jgi:hypothetical protein
VLQKFSFHIYFTHHDSRPHCFRLSNRIGDTPHLRSAFAAVGRRTRRSFWRWRRLFFRPPYQTRSRENNIHFNNRHLNTFRSFVNFITIIVKNNLVSENFFETSHSQLENNDENEVSSEHCLSEAVIRERVCGELQIEEIVFLITEREEFFSRKISVL